MRHLFRREALEMNHEHRWQLPQIDLLLRLDFRLAFLAEPLPWRRDPNFITFNRYIAPL